MIIETILSSVGEGELVNFAPVGVHIPDETINLAEVKDIEIFLYSGSDTFNNLKTTPEGVINFTDDVLSFVDTALYSVILPTLPSRKVKPPRMSSAGTIWEFSVTHFDDSRDPAQVKARILHMEESKGFSGFCRAQGVILEAAIMATRIQWIEPDKIIYSYPSWREVVAKTGGIREREALRKLKCFFEHKGIIIPD